jgi:hypothetical protein
MANQNREKILGITDFSRPRTKYDEEEDIETNTIVTNNDEEDYYNEEPQQSSPQTSQSTQSSISTLTPTLTPDNNINNTNKEYRDVVFDTPQYTEYPVDTTPPPPSESEPEPEPIQETPTQNNTLTTPTNASRYEYEEDFEEPEESNDKLANIANEETVEDTEQNNTNKEEVDENDNGEENDNSEENDNGEENDKEEENNENNGGDEDNENEKITKKTNVTGEEEDDDNELLEGGADIEYSIDYIVPDDEELINPENVFKQVEQYIGNFYSDELANYKKTLKNIYQKYSNPRYLIKYSMEEHSAPTINVIKNEKKKSIVTSITMPKYKYYNKDNLLIKLSRKISNQRTALQIKYEELTAKINITPEEKKSFEKLRKSFIELLEEYYTYTLYHKKINKIVTDNKTKLIIQDLTAFNKPNEDEQRKLLVGNFYNVDNGIIDLMNQNNSDKLNQYNQLIMKLGGGKTGDKIKKDKKLVEEIKQYLDRKEVIKVSNTINKMAKKQSEYVDYIVMSLPIV